MSAYLAVGLRAGAFPEAGVKSDPVSVEVFVLLLMGGGDLGREVQIFVFTLNGTKSTSPARSPFTSSIIRKGVSWDIFSETKLTNQVFVHIFGKIGLVGDSWRRQQKNRDKFQEND